MLMWDTFGVGRRAAKLKLDETTSNTKSWQFQLSTLGFQFQLDSVGSDGVAKMVKVDLIQIIFDS